MSPPPTPELMPQPAPPGFGAAEPRPPQDGQAPAIGSEREPPAARVAAAAWRTLATLWVRTSAAMAAELGRELGGACQVCRQGSATALCMDCDRLYRPPRLRCARCALPVTDAGPCLGCRQGPPPQARTWVGVDYAFPWDGLIRRWKFHENTGLTGPLAAPLAEALAQRPVDGVAPLLVPVPLSPGRLRERGFNQAALLARALGRQLGWPCADGLLLRPVERAQQAGLTRAQRQRNLHGAFMVSPQHRAELGTRPLVLVDDVLTTGETAAEAVRTLLNAGAQVVDVAAIARTV